MQLVAANYMRLDFDIEKGNNNRFLKKLQQVVKRNAFEMDLGNSRIYYTTTLRVGSKRDKVSVLVDTGSSDLWVMDSDVRCFSPYTYYKKARDVFEWDEEEGQQAEKRGLVPHRKNHHADVDGHMKADGIGGEGPPIPIESGETAGSAFGPRSATRTSNPTGASSSTGTKTYITATGAYSGDGNSTWLATRSVGAYSYYATTDDYATLCTQNGSFATAGSDSLQFNKSAPDFEIYYADDTEASGVWVHDQVQIHNTTVKDLSFAVATRSSSTIGVLGIGLPVLEGTNVYTYSDSYTYENLPMKLKTEGIIKTNMYSLYLGEPTSEKGTILFGAVDKAKYEGSLSNHSFVMTDEDELDVKGPARIAINVDDIDVSTAKLTSSILGTSYPAVLDTGATYSYFPTYKASALADEIGGEYLQYYGAYKIPCDIKDIEVNFGFANTVIKVPISDLIIDTVEDTKSCFLGVLPSLELHYLLGDNFLRHAYVAVDLENKQIGMAPVKYSESEDIEVAVDGIPNLNVTSYDHYSGTDDEDTDESNRTSGGSLMGPSMVAVVGCLVSAIVFAV